MLDMGFIPDVKRVLAAAAEAAAEPAVLGHVLDRDQGVRREAARPAAHDRGDAAQLDGRRDRAARAPGGPRRRRAELLAWLVGHHRWQQVLVFTRTKHGADKLVRSLESDGIRARRAARQQEPERAHARARRLQGAAASRCMVATDIAARGIDIDQLPHVVNYDLPNVPEDYVHRIGRTGRAGVVRRSDLARVRRRARVPARHRAAHQAPDPAARDRRLRARSQCAGATGVRAARPQAAADARPAQPWARSTASRKPAAGRGQPRTRHSGFQPRARSSRRVQRSVKSGRWPRVRPRLPRLREGESARARALRVRRVARRRRLLAEARRRRRRSRCRRTGRRRTAPQPPRRRRCARSLPVSRLRAAESARQRALRLLQPPARTDGAGARRRAAAAVGAARSLPRHRGVPRDRQRSRHPARGRCAQRREGRREALPQGHPAGFPPARHPRAIGRRHRRARARPRRVRRRRVRASRIRARRHARAADARGTAAASADIRARRAGDRRRARTASTRTASCTAT